ncbi:MAG: complex I NDUFA9 subunit family protein, partial [bacterium]|nr:complex I NDUFA9 subunit family protein [bacterium]
MTLALAEAGVIPAEAGTAKICVLIFFICMILVTGATGFVGGHLVPRLVGVGKKLRCYVRATADIRKLEQLGVDISYGTVSDRAALKEAMTGIDAVIHLVAIIIERKNASFIQINHYGTKNVAETAQEAGVNRFIHISALGASSNHQFPYTYSKWLGEQEVCNSGLDWTIFQPSIMFGERDEFINKLAQLVRLAPVIPILGSGKTKFQPIGVEDTCTCILQALEDNRTFGKTYQIGGPEHLTYEQMVDIIMTKLNRRKLKLHLPISLMKPIVKGMETILPNPPVTTGQLALLAIDNITALDSVNHYFGFHPKRLHDGIDYI